MIHGLTENLRRMERPIRQGVKDLAIRLGILSYRPHRWTAGHWDTVYRSRATDAYGAINEVARYGVLLGYLASVGGEHASVLDVGCGAGLLRERMAQGTFRSYLGVDPTPAAVEQADRLSDTETTFVCADPMKAELGRFDVVVCNEVLYFSPDPFDLIERLEGLMLPSGHLLCSMYRHAGDVELWRRLDTRFSLIDRVWLRSEGHDIAPRGWMLACYSR